MVTRILLDPRRDLPGGDGFTSDPIVLEATPTGIREDGSVFVLPTTLSFTVNTAADVVQLPPPAASWAWRLVARQDGVPVQQRTVRFPDVPSIGYSDLTDVDPESLGDTPGHSRQWDATFYQLVTLIGTLQANLDAVTAGAPGAFNTFLEVATQQGLDESTITALQGLVAGKADRSELAGIVAGGGGLEVQQPSPASTWGPISHSFGRRPNVTVFDANGDEIAPDVHATETTLSLVFATPIAGSAVLT